MKFLSIILLFLKVHENANVEKCFYDTLFKTDNDYKLMTDLTVMKKMLLDFHLLPEKIQNELRNCGMNQFDGLR